MFAQIVDLRTLAALRRSADRLRSNLPLVELLGSGSVDLVTQRGTPDHEDKYEWR